MKKPKPFVTFLLAVFTLGIYPMRKAAKAKKQAAGGTSPANPMAGPVIPPPSAHIDSVADSMPSSPQPMAPVTPPPTPPTPVAETPAAPEQPTTTPPVTPPMPPTPSV